MSRSCTRVDRLELCLVPTEVCWPDPLTTPEQVAEVATALGLCPRPQEEVWLFCLNVRGYLTGYTILTKGTVQESVLSPAEVFRILVTHNAVSFILLHNHPSGDPSPSHQDRLLTKRLIEASKIMGVNFLDHIIISPDGGYVSLNEEGAFRG